MYIKNIDFSVHRGIDGRVVRVAEIILQIWNSKKFWPFSIILKRSGSLLEYSFYISYFKLFLSELKKGRRETVWGPLLPRLSLVWFLSCWLTIICPSPLLVQILPWTLESYMWGICSASLWNVGGSTRVPPHAWN